jgi:hypothetical protein
MGLRSDIQLLADHGIIKGTISSWPLAWGPILADVADADASSLSASIAAALDRVRERGDWDTRANQLTFRASGVRFTTRRVAKSKSAPVPGGWGNG